MPLLLGFAVIVYGRAREEAHEGLKKRLLVRASNLAGLVEIDEGWVELEVPFVAMPDYVEPESGAYFVFYDDEGEVFRASPSLGEEGLPPPPPWKMDAVHYMEVTKGPWGRPCVVITYSFLLRLGEIDEDEEDGGPAPDIPEHLRQYQVQVAIDSQERDDALAALAMFLAVAGALTTALALLGGGLLARRLMRPVRSMTETAASLTPEDPSLRLQPDRVVTELHSLALTLNSAFDRLAEALEQQKRFTADASHELRTPASILLGNAELLLRRPRTSEEYREGLERQVATAKRMATLIEDLLTLARADAGQTEIERASVDLAAAASTVCQEHAPLARANGVELACVSDPDIRVEGDPCRLTQLVTNLVGNAMKFVPRGGRVDVNVRRENGDAVLTVADDGPGIPEEHHRRLFERFYRVGADRSGRGKGTGLGLAIASWIAEVHGGRISVESRPGEGATFRVALPVST